MQSVVLDGKSGIEKAFKDIPRQMCHFHMRQIVKRYITMNPKLRSAYNSLKKHIPYLFTYKNPKYKHLNIHNTTNSIEGGVFSHMKNKISLHRGIPKGKKLSFIDFYLMKLGKKT